MDAKELADLKALCEQVTPGPWIWYAEDASMLSLCQKDNELEHVVMWATRCEACYKSVTENPEMLERLRCGWPNLVDSEFIKKSREAIPWLIAEVERLRVKAGE